MSESAEMIAVIPPLSKSLQKDLACSAMYKAKHIDRVPDIESEPARRGTEIHEHIGAYVKHLVATSQRTDYDFLRGLCELASPEAKAILEDFVESFVFDPDAVLYIEKRLAADANFEPVECDDPTAIFQGTLDLVQMLSEDAAQIDDWKSQFQIVDANSFESSFYALLLFCSNPALQKIEFALRFVRYGSASRSVEFTRADVPRLQLAAKRERERQTKLHEMAADDFKASPGKQCSYCPIIESCPLGKVNPYLNLTPEQRLAKTAHLKEAYEYSLGVMKDLVVEGGPVECRDDNGNLLRAEFRPKTMKSYPLGVTLPILTEWTKGHPGDGYMVEGLTVGGLSSPVKAKKRADLAAQLQAVAEVRVQTELRVGAAKDDEE